MVSHYTRSILGVVLTSLALTCVSAQPKPTSDPLPSLVTFDKPTVHSVDPAMLPKPFETKSAFRASKQVPQPADAKLYLAKGFKINVFAQGDFREPRWMTLAPNGDVFLSDARANSIIVLRDNNKDGVAEERFVFSDKLSQPF